MRGRSRWCGGRGARGDGAGCRGALMQRGGGGLAACVHRRFLPTCRPRVRDAGGVLVGAGDNGGDALLRGCPAGPPGARPTAVLLAARADPAGGASAPPAAGAIRSGPSRAATGTAGRRRRGATTRSGRRGSCWTGSWGSAAAAASAPRRGARAGDRGGDHRGRGPAERVDGRHRRGRRRRPCGPAHRHLRGAQAGAAGRRRRRARRGRTAGGHRPRSPERRRCRVLEPADVAGLLPSPAGGRQVHPRGGRGRRRLAAYPGGGVLCTGSAVRGGSGMVRYAGTAADARPRPLARGGGQPRASRARPAGCRPGWWVPASAPTTRPPTCCGTCWPRTCRAGRRGRADPGGQGTRTWSGGAAPHRADPARPRVRADRRARSARTGWAPPVAPPPISAWRCCSRATRPWSRAGRPGLRQPDRHPLAGHRR